MAKPRLNIPWDGDTPKQKPFIAQLPDGTKREICGAKDKKRKAPDGTPYRCENQPHKWPNGYSNGRCRFCGGMGMGAPPKTGELVNWDAILFPDAQDIEAEQLLSYLPALKTTYQRLKAEATAIRTRIDGGASTTGPTGIALFQPLERLEDRMGKLIEQELSRQAHVSTEQLKRFTQALTAVVLAVLASEEVRRAGMTPQLEHAIRFALSVRLPQALGGRGNRDGADAGAD